MFQKGDCVVIREDLSKTNEGHYVNVVKEMHKYAGAVAKVTYVRKVDREVFQMRLDIDNGRWWWDDGLVKIADIVRINQSDILAFI